MAFDFLLVGENRPALEMLLRALKSDARLATAPLRLADDTLGGLNTRSHNPDRVLQERSARFHVGGQLGAARWPSRPFGVPLLVEHLDLLTSAMPDRAGSDPMPEVWDHLIETLHHDQALVWISGAAAEPRRVPEWRTIAGKRPILIVDADHAVRDCEHLVDFLEQRLDWAPAESELDFVLKPGGILPRPPAPAILPTAAKPQPTVRS